MYILSATNISKSYDGNIILDNININIIKSDIVLITGISGSGKSTLLNILGTIHYPDNGKLIINNIDVYNISYDYLSFIRNKEIGFIFQFHNLLNEFSAIENICIPALIYGIKYEIAFKKGYELLKILNLEMKAHYKPYQLSGGENQRIAIARSIINNPSIIIADEPSGNLDTYNEEMIYEIFLMLKHKFGQTFIISTHNNKLNKFADNIFHIKNAKLIHF